MNRTQALDYLTNTYAELATEANWTETARLFAYSLMIDQSLRGLGVPEDSLQTVQVTDSDDIAAYYALLDYFALLRFSTAFSVRSDVSVSGAISSSQSQIWKQVNERFVHAETTLKGMGYSPSEQIEMGRFTLDFLEPSEEGMG